MRMVSRFALTAVLALPALSCAQSLDFRTPRLHFTLSSPHTVRLTADGVPIIRESHFYMVDPAWTVSRLNADNVTPTVTSSVVNGVSTGTAVYETADGIARYTYVLGPDDTYRVTINYATKGKPTQIEWDTAYLNANMIAGQTYSATTVSGARSGTVPIYATSPDQYASQLCPLVKSIHFSTSLGPLDISVQGSDSSVSAFRLFDARAGQQDWAQRNPIFWFGVGVGQIPTTSQGQTITVTLHLGAAPTRTIVDKLATTPTLKGVRNARVPYVEDLPVIPHPKSMYASASACRLNKSPRIVISPDATPEEQKAALEVQSELSTYWSIGAPIVYTTSPDVPNIVMGVSHDGSVPLYPEGYALWVDGGGATISGFDARGVYNGAQSLKQLLRADADGVYIKPASIRDWPSLAMRGVHWFGGPDGFAFHRKMIDLIVAPYKMNTMLYEVEFGRWASHPEIWDANRSMSKADMKRTVDYARAHFIEPIPMINSLGHADWMFTNGQHLDLATDPTVRYQYNPENPAVYNLLFDVMQEAADLFTPKYFHIGHDEVTTGGVFPKAGSTRTATDLILEDTIKINDWVKARGMQTMMWGDEFLHYPEEASDAGNAPSVAEAQARRARLPKDIIIADWHYNGQTTSYPSVPLWRNGGWQVVGVPWYDWSNIQNLARSVQQNSAMGMIQSTWCGWAMYPDIVNTSGYNQFCAYLVAAEMAWSGGNPGLSDLGYDPDNAFRHAWNRSAVDLKTYSGYVVDQAAGNCAVWDWVPRTHPTVYFPSGEQAWGGVTFSVNSPIWLAGGLNPAGTWPKAVEIPVNGNTASELDVLWGTTWRGESGSPVARFKVTYCDGQISETPIVYATQIFNFNDLRGGLQTTIAWKGTDNVGQNVGVRIWAWKNPRPDAPIQTVTITSELGEAAPVVLGLTGLQPYQAPYTMADAVRALSLAGGFSKAIPADLTRFRVPSGGTVGMAAAVHAARLVVGLDF